MTHDEPDYIDDRVVKIVFAEDGRTLVRYSVGTRVLANIGADHTTFCDVLRHVITTLESGTHGVD